MQPGPFGHAWHTGIPVQVWCNVTLSHDWGPQVQTDLLQVTFPFAEVHQQAQDTLAGSCEAKEMSTTWIQPGSPDRDPLLVPDALLAAQEQVFEWSNANLTPSITPYHYITCAQEFPIGSSTLPFILKAPRPVVPIPWPLGHLLPTRPADTGSGPDTDEPAAALLRIHRKSRS